MAIVVGRCASFARPTKQACPAPHRANSGAVVSVSGTSSCSSSRSNPASLTCTAVASSNVATKATDELLCSVSKRRVLGLAALSFAAAAGLGRPKPAAADGEYETFLGFATPPTSYGGYGGNANEPPKYTFEYPAGWTPEKPSKVEKGTQGVDGRVVNPRSKDQRAFLITLARAGEDNQSFKLRDLDSTFAGFAGADYALQDAIQSATNTTQSTRQLNGVTVYDYDIESPDYRYLSSIIFKDAKVFALFIRSPSKLFKGSEAKLRHIQDSFKLL